MSTTNNLSHMGEVQPKATLELYQPVLTEASDAELTDLFLIRFLNVSGKPNYLFESIL